MSAIEIEIMKKFADVNLKVASRTIAITTNEFPTKLTMRMVLSMTENKTSKLIVAVAAIFNWKFLFRSPIYIKNSSKFETREIFHSFLASHLMAVK